ncbi:MAG: twin-arginine translocase subunit TatC [Cyclobacteriaceae bacterium]
MSFLDHLEELRWHIVRSVASIGVFTVIAFMSKDFIFGKLILGPSKADFWTYRMLCKLSQMSGSDYFCMDSLPFIIQNRQMTAQFTMHITSSIVAGLICAFPYAFWEIWRFVSPGLYDNERNISRGAVFFVTILFATGVLFGYYMVAPLSIRFLSHYQLDPSILNEIDLTSYVSTVIMMVMACAIMFQLPIVIFFLTKIGVVTPPFLRTYRKHAIVIMLVVSAILTPPDIISQLLLCIPLIFLYELSIILSAMVVRAERKRLKA